MSGMAREGVTLNFAVNYSPPYTDNARVDTKLNNERTLVV